MSIQVVVAKYKENIDWVERCPHDTVVYSKSPADNNYVPHGKDGEASSYFRYILDHYDDLKEWTLFVHGHEHHWHHPMSILKSCEIDTKSLPKTCKFFSVNHGKWGIRDKYTDYQLQHKTMPIMINKNTRRDVMPSELTSDEYTEALIQLFGVEEFNAMMSKNFPNSNKIEYQIYPMSSQFYVHKDRILARPKSFYQACYRIFEDMDLKHDNTLSKLLSKKAKCAHYQKRRIAGFFFEALWHYIFGEELLYRPVYFAYNNYPFRKK